jgi:elongation factor P
VISTADFRKGVIIEWNGQPNEILWFQNHKMAAEEAVMRVKIKNLYTGSIVERTFKNGERFKDISATKRKTQFLYAEGDTFHFMDMQNYEQIGYPREKLGDSAQYMSENMEVEALYLDDKFLSISLPASVELKVTSTVPGIKGDSVSNMMKPATLESGVELQVPLFIKEGDTIKVDTRTGEYLARI